MSPELAWCQHNISTISAQLCRHDKVSTIFVMLRAYLFNLHPIILLQISAINRFADTLHPSFNLDNSSIWMGFPKKKIREIESILLFPKLSLLDWFSSDRPGTSLKILKFVIGRVFKESVRIMLRKIANTGLSLFKFLFTWTRVKTSFILDGWKCNSIEIKMLSR